jgi:hypothetical protein
MEDCGSGWIGHGGAAIGAESSAACNVATGIVASVLVGALTRRRWRIPAKAARLGSRGLDVSYVPIPRPALPRRLPRKSAWPLN